MITNRLSPKKNIHGLDECCNWCASQEAGELFAQLREAPCEAVGGFGLQRL